MKTFFLPMKSIAMRTAKSKKTHKSREKYTIFIGPKEWATFIEGFRG